MELGDLIFPLLIIGSVIVQWLSSRNKEEDEQAPPDLPSERSPQRRESKAEPVDPSWDDLIEALGQPTAPPEIPPVVMDTPVVPPPVPEPEPELYQYQAPETPSYLNQLERQKEQLEAKQQEAERIRAQSKLSRARSSASQPEASSYQGEATDLDLRQMLNNRQSLKKAIVLNEILQPPVSLR